MLCYIGAVKQEYGRDFRIIMVASKEADLFPAGMGEAGF
jgi:hypothetical protein